MAITIGASSGAKMLRVTWEDIKGETMVSIIPLDVAITDEDVVIILTALETCSNAKIKEAALQTSRLAEGLATAASDASQNLVAARLGLTLEKANPLNANKTVAKMVQIPAYADILYVGGAVKSDDVILNGLIAVLQESLSYQAIDETWYPDNWVYTAARSGFFTVPSKTDGL
jgi:hypothetical protein